MSEGWIQPDSRPNIINRLLAPKSSHAWAVVSLFLAAIGVYIAGALSLSHIYGSRLPCPINAGCDALAHHPSTKIMGIPLAVFGLAAYLVVLSLALSRYVRPSSAADWRYKASYLICGVGSLISFALIGYAWFSLDSFCPWCWASAVTMTLLTLVHSLETGSEPRPVTRKPNGMVPVFVVLALGVGTVPLIAAERVDPYDTPHDPVALKNTTYDELVPSDAPSVSYGNDDTVFVVFSDPFCPSCASNWPLIHKVAKGLGGAKVVFRHFPLRKETGSWEAATTLDLTEQFGVFWRVHDRSRGAKNPAEVRDIAIAEGVPAAALKQKESKLNGPTPRVARDEALARKLKLPGAPMIIVVRRGEEPRLLSPLAFALEFRG